MKFVLLLTLWMNTGEGYTVEAVATDMTGAIIVMTIAVITAITATTVVIAVTGS